MKKFKLKAVLSLILSLGVIASSSPAFASSAEKAMNMGAGKDGSSSNKKADEDDKKITILSARWMYKQKGIRIKQILAELKRGKLGSIQEELYRVPTGREFVAYRVSNRKLLKTKYNYWYDFIKANNMKKEYDLVMELHELADDALKEFYSLLPEILLYEKLGLLK